MIYEGFKLELARFSSIQIVAYAQTGNEALHLFGRVQADIAVIDVMMPEIDGFELARRAMRAHPGMRVLFLSGMNSPAYVERARQLGAAGWVVKDSFAELIKAIALVTSGSPFISPPPEHRTTILPSVDAPVIPTEGKEALTPREIEVLRMTVESLEVKEIAGRLGISVRTVEVHRAHIFQKLRTRSIAQLTKFAIAHGYTAI